MIFDKSTIIAGMKMGMEPDDKARTDDIELAIGLCLDDLSTRLVSKGFLSAYDVPLTAGVRDKELTGANDDLNYIFAIKYTEGSTIAWLEYYGQEVFLRDYDLSTELSGPPTIWTFFSANDGYPVIKLDRNPAANSELTVYYYPSYTPDNVQMARSASAILAGALAYFYGIENPKGAPYYQRFERGAFRMRAADDYRAKPISRIVMSKDDLAIKSATRAVLNKRMP